LLAIHRNDAQLTQPVRCAAVLRGRLPRRVEDAALDFARLRLVGKRELLDFLPGVLGELQRESRRSMRAFALERPVLLSDEGRDLFLALADHAQRGALHAARREAAPDLLPEKRREIEADEVVERPARLLRIDQIERQIARLRHRLADRVARDLIEDHPMDRLAVELAAGLEDLLQVPGDCLALAIRVGGEIERFRLREPAGDALDVACVLLEHLVAHRIATLRIDCPFFRDEIADVAVRGQHLEVLTQVFLDGLRLGGRFDHDQIVSHVSAVPRRDQCRTEPSAADMTLSKRANASSCPGWLERTRSTTHLSCSTSTSSTSSASARSMTSSRCRGARTCWRSSSIRKARQSGDNRDSSPSAKTRNPPPPASASAAAGDAR